MSTNTEKPSNAAPADVMPIVTLASSSSTAEDIPFLFSWPADNPGLLFEGGITPVRGSRVELVCYETGTYPDGKAFAKLRWAVRPFPW